MAISSEVLVKSWPEALEVSRERFLFAEILRGPAAILVLVSHAFGLFWSRPDDVAHLFGLTLIGPTPVFPLSIPPRSSEFIGQIGVSTFFLISGFVIALSVERQTTKRFLLRRLVRIYPVYWASFLTTVTAGVLIAALFGGTLPYGSSEALVHLLILPREWLGVPIIDGVSWTLEIELMFYLFMAVMGRTMLNSGPFGLVAATGLCAALGAGLTLFDGYDWIARQVGMFPLFFIGIAGLLHMRMEASLRAVLVIAVLALFSSGLTLFLSPRFGALADEWVSGHAVGVGVFFACYAVRGRLVSVPILQHFAAISYPLYASHIYLVYATLISGVIMGLSPFVTVPAAIVLAWGVAVSIHHLVELRALRLIKRI